MMEERSTTEPVDASTSEILRRRAERLRAPPVEESDVAVESFAAFSIDSERFALPLASLKAIIELTLVTPVPLVPAHVIGIVRYQGEIVTALSLAALLRDRSWSADTRFLLIVEPEPGRVVGLDCGEIPLAMTLPRQVVASARERDDGAVREVMTPEHQLIGILDVPRLLERSR
jgi:chemotaxis signal transduction protein